jgi:hypothetical protein
MDGDEQHVDLWVAGARGGMTQPVPARELEDGTFEILASPGLVQGVAAGDVIRLSDRHAGAFDVIRHGGNVCVQILRSAGIAPVVEWLVPRMGPLSARLDGKISRGAVYTIPVTVGFQAIEELMAEAVKMFEDLEWYYGNVYGPDGITPLNWWLAR